MERSIELRLENLENQDGNVLEQANAYVVAMYEDLLKRAGIVKPHRKVVITTEMYEDDDGDIVTEVMVELKLPGNYPKLKFSFKGEIRKNKNQLELIFPGKEKIAS